MLENILFRNIKNGLIFAESFSNLGVNNTISFSDQGIAIIYGPNGAGKTSIAKVLSSAQNTSFEAVVDGKVITNGGELFHVIHDQNNRNIIQGNVNEFLIGENIAREQYLKIQIDKEFETFRLQLNKFLKESFLITTISNPIILKFKDEKLVLFVKELANSKSRGEKIKLDDLIDWFQKFEYKENVEYDEIKMRFLCENFKDKDSIIQQVLNLSSSKIMKNDKIKEVEENSDAIKILGKYSGKNECIVCDTMDIDYQQLLESKRNNTTEIFSLLDENVKKLIESIISQYSDIDPLNIKDHLVSAIEAGTNTEIDILLRKINELITSVEQTISNQIYEAMNGSDIVVNLVEYKKLISESPVISDEDYLYIERIIKDGMRKSLVVERASDKSIRVTLSETEFLERDRNSLPLSTGEQNFLSLTFEFLRARKTQNKIIVIDDPISSFDSLYKNKVVYAIVKMLENKPRILLTHNTDVLRLMESQFSNCYELYLLNNTYGEVNGFIYVSQKEKDFIISVPKLLNFLHDDVFKEIKHIELFLKSMVPFMRGYSEIVRDKDSYEKLTEVMHGYKVNEIDIADIYRTLFKTNNDIIPESFTITATSLMSDLSYDEEILSSNYPLLNRTLQHSYAYLVLRLLVEQSLIQKFKIKIKGKEKLGQLISLCFPSENSNKDAINMRVRLTSKKTLINEFNHFEGNLSIFQPAIDITDKALNEEIDDILELIKEI